jgi:hypothetical protein
MRQSFNDKGEGRAYFGAATGMVFNWFAATFGFPGVSITSLVLIGLPSVWLFRRVAYRPWKLVVDFCPEDR